MGRLRIGAVLVAAVMFSAGPLMAAEVIPVIVKDTTSAFWQVVLSGARAASADLGVEIATLGAQAETDISGQIAILENAVSQSPPAIVIAPTSFESLGPPIDEAANSVPIIGIDSPANSESFTSFLATDNNAGGRLAADALALAIEKHYGEAKGDVALLTAVPGVGSLTARNNGFIERLKNYPGLRLVTERIGDGQIPTALMLTLDVIVARPNLRGVFADNIIMGIGAGQAVAESGLEDQIMVVSFDSSEQLEGFLEDDIVKALIVQDPFRMGYQGVETALRVANGESVEAFVDTGVHVITADNMSSQRSQSLLHPATGN